MKILFFTPYFYPYVSGMTVYSQLIFEELNKRHDIEILTFKYNSELEDKIMVKGLLVHRMPFLCKISKGFISPQSINIFLTKIKNKDLLVINLPSVEGLFLVFLAKLLRVKVLAVFHCKIDLGPGIITKFFIFVINLLVKLQLSLATQIVAFSADYINSLNWSNKLKNKVVYIKPIIKNVKENLSTLNIFKIKKGKQYWIGYVGRISREKGIHYLIEAIKLLPNYKQFSLVFVGPKYDQVAGENKYYLNLINQLKNSQINYIFLGLLSDEDLFSFYKSIDLLALPSINSTEAYGLVQLEAMSVGTPVIASNLPGLREAIQEIGMGVLVSPADAQQLSKAIVKIISSKNKYRLSKMQKKLKSYYSKKLCIQEYEKIIKKIIK